VVVDVRRKTTTIAAVVAAVQVVRVAVVLAEIKAGPDSTQ
jgi:hypothetical protein